MKIRIDNQRNEIICMNEIKQNDYKRMKERIDNVLREF